MTSDLVHHENYLEKAAKRVRKRQEEAYSSELSLQDIEDECGGDSMEDIVLTNMNPGEYVVAYGDEDNPWLIDEFVEDMVHGDYGDTVEIIVKDGIFRVIG